MIKIIRYKYDGSKQKIGELPILMSELPSTNDLIRLEDVVFTVKHCEQHYIQSTIGYVLLEVAIVVW